MVPQPPYQRVPCQSADHDADGAVARPDAGFLVYGLYHGLVLCCNEALDTRWKKFKKLKRRPMPRAVMTVATFHLFAFGLLLFSGKLI